MHLRLSADAAAVENQQLKDQIDSLRSVQDTADAAHQEARAESQKNALMAAHISRLEEQARQERQLMQSQIRHLTSEVARLQAVNRSLCGRSRAGSTSGSFDYGDEASGRSVSALSRGSTPPRSARSSRRSRVAYDQGRRESRLLTLSRLQGAIGNEYSRNMAALQIQHAWTAHKRSGRLHRAQGARMKQAFWKLARAWKRCVRVCVWLCVWLCVAM